MPKSVSLGDHLEHFVASQVKAGRYNNDSEVVRAGLRLLEEHELKFLELRALIDAGDHAIAEGRTTVVDEPASFASAIIARGRARATKKVRA